MVEYTTDPEYVTLVSKMDVFRTTGDAECVMIPVCPVNAPIVTVSFVVGPRKGTGLIGNPTYYPIEITYENHTSQDISAVSTASNIRIGAIDSMTSQFVIPIAPFTLESEDVTTEEGQIRSQTPGPIQGTPITIEVEVWARWQDASLEWKQSNIARSVELFHL